MLKKIINNGVLNSKPSQTVTSAAFVIIIAGIASRILGLVRDRFLASTFGAGDTLDIYYAAFRIPDLVYNLLILGALSAAFIPVFTGLISREKKEEAWETAQGILNLAIFFIIAVSIILAVFAPFIIKLLTPGFSEAKMIEVVKFTRIMFLSPLLLGISGIFGSILTSFKKFFVYSLSPIFYNLGIIIGVVLFVRFMGPIGLAWGVVLGAFLHMAVQYPAIRNSGFRMKLIFKKAFSNRNVRKIIKLMIPRTLGIAVNQINLLVITIFASLLSAGSLAIFSFSQNLQSVPLGVFGVSFAIAVFPTFSSLYAQGKKEEFIQNFSQIFRQILFFVIPLSVAMLALRAQIVRVVLGAGKFDWEDTILTFQCLGIFVLSLFAQSLIPLLARAFYAMQDTKTPFIIALITEGINIGALLLLIGKYQVIGLAAAFSIAAVAQMLILLFVFRNRFNYMDDRKIIRSVLKISLASLIAGLAIQIVKYLVAMSVDLDTFLGIFAQLSISGIVGFGIFILVAHTTNMEEFFSIKDSIKKKLSNLHANGKKQIQEDTTDVTGM